MEMIRVSNTVRNDILQNSIEPLYKEEIKNKINDTKCWRITGSVFETLSKLFLSCGAILSFSSGYFNNATLSFVSGSISTVSLAFLQFSAYCYKEQNRNITELNMLLKKLNIETFPNTGHISSVKTTDNAHSNESSTKSSGDIENKIEIVTQ